MVNAKAITKVTSQFIKDLKDIATSPLSNAYTSKISVHMDKSTSENSTSSDDTNIQNSFKSHMMSENFFLKDLKESMFDISKLQSFMEEAEYHPPHAWHKALLFFYQVQNSIHTSYIDPLIINNFIDELVTKFPDVLQRVLLRGAYEDKHEEVLGAVHIAVICRQTKIIELLTKVESKIHIKQCLIECAKYSHDEFKAIERTLLWTNLKESSQNASCSYTMTKFINEFKEAKRFGNNDKLQQLIANAHLYPKDAWRTALLWASASGQNHIVRKFKEEKSELFANIRESSQKEGFSPLRTTSTKGKETSTRERQEICDLIGDLVDLSDGPYYRELLAQNLHSRMGQGWTPLHIATILKDDKILDLLIDCYNNHQTWEKIADKLNSYKNSDLKEHHKKKQFRAYNYHDFSDDSWMTPLHYAILGEDEKIVRKLLKWETYKPHLNAFNLFMCTSFHMASSVHGGSSMLQVLMENTSIDVNVEDCCSFSPLHWVVYVRATDSIRFLLSKSTDPNRPIKMSEEDVEGRQAFAIAVENETWKLLTSLPEVKQEVERLYRDRQVYVDAANAILVGAALIAGVTFGGWLSPPIGVPNDFHFVRVYWAFNSLSFFFSIATVMAGAATVLPMEDVYIGKAVKGIREWLILTSFLLVISVIFVLGAFTAAGFASLDSSVPLLKNNMLVTSCIGCLVCGAIGISFLAKLFAICQAWGYKYFVICVRFISRAFRCIQIGVTSPLNPIIYGIDLDIKEDWNIIGRKWKGREMDWKRHRGIHHLGRISTSSCRKYALHNVRSAHNKLLAACDRLIILGTTLAQEYGEKDRDIKNHTQRILETEKLQSIDEGS